MVTMLAGRTSCVNDSDLRASRTVTSPTSDGANRCPGPTNFQARSTTDASTSMPASGRYDSTFSSTIVPRRGMGH
jgi:hypothetical protein